MKKFLDLQVNCALEPYRAYKVQMAFFREKETDEWFPLPCNGCDFRHGCKECEECQAAITLMFYRGVEMDLTRPITPKMPPKAQPDA